MIGHEVPTRTQAAALIKGGFNNKPGTLSLYRDRLVFVSSKLAMVGPVFGAAGVLVTRSVANARAAGKAASGDKSTLVIPLSTVAEVAAQGSKLAHSVIFRTTTGEEYRFGGLKFDKWSDDLRGAFAGINRTVTSLDGRFTVR